MNVDEIVSESLVYILYGLSFAGKTTLSPLVFVTSVLFASVVTLVTEKLLLRNLFPHFRHYILKKQTVNAPYGS